MSRNSAAAAGPPGRSAGAGRRGRSFAVLSLAFRAAGVGAWYDAGVRHAAYETLNVCALLALLACAAVWVFCASGELNPNDGRFRMECASADVTRPVPFGSRRRNGLILLKPSTAYRPLGQRAGVEWGESFAWSGQHVKSQEQGVRTRVFLIPAAWPLGVAALTALIVAARFVVRRRHGRRSSHAQCPHCGYDCRATSGRCPECGTPVIGASIAADWRAASTALLRPREGK